MGSWFAGSVQLGCSSTSAGAGPSHERAATWKKSEHCWAFGESFHGRKGRQLGERDFTGSSHGNLEIGCTAGTNMAVRVLELSDRELALHGEAICWSKGDVHVGDVGFCKSGVAVEVESMHKDDVLHGTKQIGVCLGSVTAAGERDVKASWWALMLDETSNWRSKPCVGPDLALASCMKELGLWEGKRLAVGPCMSGWLLLKLLLGRNWPLGPANEFKRCGPYLGPKLDNGS